jgi:hypothetical protein
MKDFEGKEFIMWRGYFRIGNKMLHRLIWEKIHGPIPPYHVIHHKDGNKLNNSIDNLECLSQSEHSRLHRLQDSERYAKRMSERSEELHQWHRSEEGRKRMSERALKLAADRPYKDFTCKHCLKPFQSKATISVKYCGDNCVMRARRARKADMEDRACVICSASFTINRYQLTKTCSYACRNKLISLKRLKKIT